MGFYCEEDSELFFKIYGEMLKLFGQGKGKERIVIAFNNRLKEVFTYDGQYSDNNINSVTPGKTGFESDNHNSKVHIRLKGVKNNPNSKAQIEHYFRHEEAHAFSIAAQDVFFKRKIAGIGQNGIPYFSLTKIKDSEYIGISGSIYKKMESGENENTIYGGGFCEAMTDLFAVASKVASSSEMKKQGITVDTVLKRPNEYWNKEEITTGYFKGMPLARLAIAAFSNHPNIQYQYILDTGGSIFSTTKTDTKAVVNINDFIYGSMCDPLYIAEEYDKIVGKPGAYFELCKPVDKIVDDFANKRPVNNENIQFVIQQLTTFAKHRGLIKVQEGIFSQEYADEIYNEFEKIKNDVEKEYGISEEKDKQTKSSAKISPTAISEVSKRAMRQNPGTISEKVKKSHSIFKFPNRDKDNKRR